MIIEPGTYVLAIMPDNGSLHVGTADAAAPHLATDVAEGEPDYFDQEGRPLALVTAQNGTSVFTVDMRVPAVAESVLLGRINAALDHLQEVLNEQISEGLPDDEGGEVPRPTGSLDHVLGQLAIAFDNLEDTNKGNWFHNLAHAAGIR
jgi:hypothetical protein